MVDELIRLWEGDALDVLATIPDRTYTAVLTDPPYGLGRPPDPLEVMRQWLADGDYVRRNKRGQVTGSGFLGHSWDSFVPGPRLWREVFRTCKPGAIGAVFASARTQHWMALALVLAGFEVIDTVGWVSAAGMVKSGTIDKRIDRRRHDRDVVLRCTKWIRQRCNELKLRPRDLDVACGTNGMGSHWTSAKSQPYVPTREQWAKLEPLLGPMPPEMEAQRLIIEARAPGEDWAKREVVGKHPNPATPGTYAGRPTDTLVGAKPRDEVMLSLPATDASAEWAGYSTQLAPGIEPVIVVRRPCEGTAVSNVLAHGCGAFNIDACRLPVDQQEREVIDARSGAGQGTLQCAFAGRTAEEGTWKSNPGGRWPKNVMLDAASAVILDDMTGERKSGSRRAGAYGRRENGDGLLFSPCAPREQDEIKGSSGGPSRFFWVGPLATEDDVDLPIRYVSKASKKDRVAGLPDGARNDHITVKPPALMEWLCRLVGHPKGRMLDPFAGSGTTLRAARKMGLPCDGIERDHHYCIDLAAPRAGVDPADVVRVDPPPAPPASVLVDVPASPPLTPAHDKPMFFETVRPVQRVTIVGPRPPAPVFTVDPTTAMPTLEIPVAPRLQADDFANMPPMFPRLPGAPETT